jgi:hypothetical protein
MIWSRGILTLHSCRESKIIEFIQVNIGINQVFKPSLLQKHKSTTFTQLWEDLCWYRPV